MKSLVLCLSFLSLPAFASGGNDGPSAVPPPPKAHVLAERALHCGFFCPDGDSRSTVIYADGRVLAISEKRGGKRIEKEFARLSPEATAILAKAVAGIVSTELRDEDAGSPECFDAPSTIYAIYTAAGERVEIRKDYGCHRHTLVSGGGKDIAVTLDGLSNVAPFQNIQATSLAKSFP